MKSSIFLGFGLVAALACSPPSAMGGENCPSTREYITSLEFIRSRTDIGVLDKDAQRIASNVAQGCAGAAQRFIRVSSILLRSGLSLDKSLDTGLEFAKKPDVSVDTFAAIFKAAFAEDGLDLDLNSALQMARSLSSEFEGDSKISLRDFESMLRFCTKAENLDLPRPQCGAFALRVTRYGESWDSKSGVYRSFADAFEFLRSEKGPRMTTGQALQTAEKLVASGPLGTENFIQAYRYAVSAKGLALDADQALAFARKMSIVSPAKTTQQ